MYTAEGLAPSLVAPPPFSSLPTKVPSMLPNPFARSTSSTRFLVRLAILFAFALPALLTAEEDITFTEHVAPIFYGHCVSCHRPNDVAPMSLLTFEEARPWAKSIRKAVMSRDMPPWDADPRHGRFSNDISLSDEEVEVVARWVEQGALEGDPAALPTPPALPEAGSWRLGREPDYVVELAPVDVPAGGPDLFVTQVYGMEVPSSKWVQAIELLPGNTDVLHHVVTYLGPFGIDEDSEESSNAGVNSLIYLNERAKRQVGMAEAPRIGGVWVAGSPPSEFAPGSGHPLKANELISFNMHYHPSGTAGTDASKLGIYFGEGEMEKEITTAFAADPGMFIPAGAGEHHEEALYMFTQDSSILSLLPHMHNRGKAMAYTLERPDGSEEVVLSVPEYDYDWQNIYEFEEPVKAPAGSVMRVEAVWDNSAKNPGNPDPTLDVPWGDGTNNEMLVAFINFIVDEGKKPKPVRSEVTIKKLLDRHPPSDRPMLLTIDGMGFGGPMGLTIPEQGEGDFYLTLGSLMFSTSIPHFEKVGEEIVFNGSLITSGGGTRMPIGFVAHPSESGGFVGEAFFGRDVTAETLDEMRGKGRPFEALPHLSASAAATGAGG